MTTALMYNEAYQPDDTRFNVFGKAMTVVVVTRDGRLSTYQGVTEVDWRYSRGEVNTDRVAIESDLHSTGLTVDIRSISLLRIFNPDFHNDMLPLARAQGAENKPYTNEILPERQTDE